MKHLDITVPDGKGIFRLAYTSRATSKIERAGVVCLAADAAARNRESGVSGVLFSGNGVFLQWLEGSADDVCSLMDRIAADPRHKEVSILKAGWIPSRRYPTWPMQLSSLLLEPETVRRAKSYSPYDPDSASSAFERAAESHHWQARMASSSVSEVFDFASALVTTNVELLPAWPQASEKNLFARAHLVDDVCATFSCGWHEDKWSAADISVGLSNLNCLWQRAGRSPEPVCPRSCIAVVVPPGSGEVIGAIVKADLLRATGISVQMVIEPEAERAILTLSKSCPDAIIVAGPRVGHTGDAARSKAFAEKLRAKFTSTQVYVGGRTTGRLRDWPDRLASRHNAAAGLKVENVDWLAMSALAIVARTPKWTAQRLH